MQPVGAPHLACGMIRGSLCHPLVAPLLLRLWGEEGYALGESKDCRGHPFSSSTSAKGSLY